MKRLFLISLMTALVFALIFGGCAQPAPAPAPKPSPSPSPTASPAPTVPPSVPKTPAPAPAPAPTPTIVKPIELRFAHPNPPQSRAHVRFIEPWTKKVEEATKGRVKITIYPAQTLAKSTEIIEATRNGVADMAWNEFGIFAGRFPLSSVINLPFLNLPSGKLERSTLSGGAVNSRIIEELYEKTPEVQAEWADVKALFLFADDPHWLATSKKPVRNQADLKGMKIGEVTAPAIEMWKALGASPVNMPFPALYEAGDKGVIDGATMLWSGLGSFRFYEVFHYKINMETTVTGYFVIVNKDTWNSLPADIQQAIMSVSGVTGAEFAGDAMFGTKTEEEVRAQMKAANAKFEEVNLDSGEKDKWRATGGKPIWDKWVADMKAKGLPGQKVMDSLSELIKKYQS